MTRKEKVRELDPEHIGHWWHEGVYLCPSEYDFLKLPELNYNNCDGECDKCWNAEWTEPVKPKWQQDILDKFMRVM
mgnify:CR=1 FL=1